MLIKYDKEFVGLIYLLLSILIASTAAGINVVAFPAILLQNNIPSFFIGFSTTIELVFGVITALFINNFVAKFRVIRSAFFIAIFYALIISVISFYQNFYFWLLLSGLGGSCWVALFVIRQSWINHIVSDKNRSVVLALTTTIFCTGFIFGSFIIKHFGAINHLSFFISASLILFSILILLLIKNTEPKKIDTQNISFKNFIKAMPEISLARFLLDFQGACLVCLGVIFGVKTGLKVENAGLLIAAFMASGFFDLYAGFLAKTLNRKLMIRLGFLICLGSMLIALLFYQSFIILLICFFIFGCGTALILISSLTSVNESFEKSKLITANATFQAIGSIGAIAGSFIGGTLIQIFDFYGFFITIILANLIYLLYEKN